MTEEEIRLACQKFVIYLRANGVSVYAHMLYADDVVHRFGGAKSLSEAMLMSWTDEAGLKVTRK